MQRASAVAAFITPIYQVFYSLLQPFFSLSGEGNISFWMSLHVLNTPLPFGLCIKAVNRKHVKEKLKNKYFILVLSY